MPHFGTVRQLLRAVRERLDEWVYEARSEAFDELFEGPDAILTDDEVALVDRIDSRLSREEGEGLWGEDEYRIVLAGAIEEEGAPHVVCTYYPQIPEYVPAGAPLVDEETRETLNDALWEYTEGVVEFVRARLGAFVWSSEVETRVE